MRGCIILTRVYGWDLNDWICENFRWIFLLSSRIKNRAKRVFGCTSSGAYWEKGERSDKYYSICDSTTIQNVVSLLASAERRNVKLLKNDGEHMLQQLSRNENGRKRMRATWLVTLLLLHNLFIPDKKNALRNGKCFLRS